MAVDGEGGGWSGVGGWAYPVGLNGMPSRLDRFDPVPPSSREGGRDEAVDDRFDRSDTSSSLVVVDVVAVVLEPGGGGGGGRWGWGWC